MGNNNVPIKHPLRGHLSAMFVDQWIERIAALDDGAVDDAVVLGFSVGGVHERTQRNLAEVVKTRRDHLADLVGRACA